MPFFYVELDATWFNVICAPTLKDAVNEAKVRTGLTRVSQAREAQKWDFEVVEAMERMRCHPTKEQP